METKLAAGNRVIYSRKSKGSTTGSLGFYGMPKEVYATLFGSKENTKGDILYGMKELLIIKKGISIKQERNLTNVLRLIQVMALLRLYWDISLEWDIGPLKGGKE